MLFFFFFNDTATTEIYTLSLHDALPICSILGPYYLPGQRRLPSSTELPMRPDEQGTPLVFSGQVRDTEDNPVGGARSEEHTSELQSRQYLVCRLLLEKKKNIVTSTEHTS